VDRVETYLVLAHEIRARAQQLQDIEARERLMEVAEQYELLAQQRLASGLAARPEPDYAGPSRGRGSMALGEDGLWVSYKNRYIRHPQFRA
jgi:hypothetical protein